MTADIFSKRRDDQISTICQRGLKDRSQQRIVNDDNRPLGVRTVEAGHDLPGMLEINHSVCWVCWRFDVQRRNRTFAGADFKASSIALLPPSLRKPIEVTPNCGRIFFSRKSVPP